MAQALAEFQGSDYHRTFLRRRQQALWELFRHDRGAWYVALLDDAPVGSLGVVVTGGRARYQSVDTAQTHRRQGLARRLIADAAAHVHAHNRIEQLVIVADPAYHAIGIYEELGFRRLELVIGALLKPEDA